MNKIIISLFFLVTFAKNTIASDLSFACNFEEAHSNGSINQGLILYKENKLRYEYFSKDLFIIFINKKGTFLYNNKNKTTKPFTQTIQIIDQMMDIASKFPDIPTNIRQDDIDIKLEFNKSKKFIKRISIDSNRAKLSLYLKNCNLNKPINNLFFSENPVFRYQ